MATRISLHDFILANPIYVGATVTAWLVDVNGNVTTNKATLYEAPTGTSQLANPQTLDSDGKFQQPVYCEQAVRLEVSGLHITTHTTGVISPGGTWRGDWAGATLYQAGDWVRDGAAGDNTLSVYQIVNTHTSGTWGVDVLDATKLALVIDYTSITAQVVPDATERTKGRVRLATMLDQLAGRRGLALQPEHFLALWALHEPANFSAAQADINAALAIDKFIRPDRLWAAPMRGGRRNIVGRNGGMEVWSRATSVAVAASTPGYAGPDGWYFANGANQASTISRQAGLKSQSQFAARVQRDAGQIGTGFMSLQFPLDTDELMRLRDAQQSLRFTARAGASWSPTSGTLFYRLYVGTGAVGPRGTYTSEVALISGSVDLTPGAAAVDIASPLGSLGGATITQATAIFVWQPVGAAGANDWVEIDDVHIENAPIIPEFERPPVEDELRACRRHLAVLGGEATNVPIGSGYARSTTVARIMVPFGTRMRKPPTGITVANAANFRLVRAATTVAVSSMAFVQASSDAAFIDVTVAAGLTANEGLLLETNNTDCQIAFTGAEV